MTAAAAAPPNALAKRALPIAVAAIAVYPTLLILKGAAERPTLVFFLAPTCPVCKKLIPVLKALQRDERRQRRSGEAHLHGKRQARLCCQHAADNHPGHARADRDREPPADDLREPFFQAPCLNESNSNAWSAPLRYAAAIAHSM